MRLDVAALLFDNDGVLVDSHEQVLAAWRQLASELGLDPDRLLGEVVGVRAVDTLSRYLPAADVPAAVARLEDLEVAGAATSVALAGAIELIGRTPAGRWTIVTSGSRRLAEARWRGAGIPIPPVAITADDVARGKPDPEPYVRAAALLGVDPAECLVFEDSGAGALAAVAAGARVIAVGDEPWDVEPVARIGNLTAVSVAGGADGLAVELERSR